MANQGKFIDRSPIICPAGKVFTKPNDNVAGCLQFYPIEDAMDALKHDVGIWNEKEEIKLPQQQMINTRHRGIYTEIKPILMPPIQTRFQTLINELKETPYESQWNKSTGASRDYVSGLPAGMQPMEITFGSPPIRGESIAELINPPKTVYQVLYDSQIGHDLYKKTHDDYNPGEQVNRNYLQPPYDPDKCYGESTLYDPSGIWVRCACHWHIDEPVIAVSKLQADYVAKNVPQLGKALSPNNNLSCVPKGHRFGKKSTRDLYGVEDLLKDPDCPPCLFKRDFLNWIQTLNELRAYVFKRRETTSKMKNLISMARYYDKEHSGWLDKKTLYDILECKGLNFDPVEIEPLLKIIGILSDDDHIFYPKYITLIDLNKPLPEIRKIQDIPQKNQYYFTTYQAMSCDFIIIDNSVLPSAGIPSVRYDLPTPSKRPGECRADLESLGDETTAEAAVNPSIYTNYGLNHRDFFQPRQPQVIRKIFENIGYKFTNESFNVYWELGMCHDKTGLVCIDTFKKLLKKYAPPKEYIHKAERLIDLAFCEGGDKYDDKDRTDPKLCQCRCLCHEQNLGYKNKCDCKCPCPKTCLLQQQQ